MMRVPVNVMLVVGLTLSICGSVPAREVPLVSEIDQAAEPSRVSVLPALKLQTGSTGQIKTAAFSRDMSIIATSSGAEVIVWDIATGRELRRFSQPRGTVEVLRFGLGRETLLVGGTGALAQWNTATGTMGRPCSGLPGPVVAAEFAEESATFIAACKKADDKGTSGLPTFGLPSRQNVYSLLEFDPRTGGQTALWSTEADRVAISADGSRVAALRSARDQRMEVRDARTGAIRHIWDLAPEARPYGAVLDLRFLDGGRLAIGTSKQVHILDAATGKVLKAVSISRFRPAQELKGGTSIGHVSVSGDGRRVLAGLSDGTARLWDVDTGREVESIVVSQGRYVGVSTTAFSAGDRLLVAGGEDGRAVIWDPGRGAKVQELRGWSTEVTGVACSADGRVIYVSLKDGTIRAWDRVEGRQVASTSQGMPILDLAVGGDSVLTAGSRGAEVCAWTAGGLAPRGLFQVYRYNMVAQQEFPVAHVRLSPDARLFAAEGLGSEIYVRRTADGRLERRLPTGRITAYRFVPGPAGGPPTPRLIVGDADGTVSLWALDADRPIWRLEARPGSRRAVRDIIVRADGGLAWVLLEDGPIERWDLAAPRRLDPLAIPDGDASAIGGGLVNHPDLLAVAGPTGISVWDANGEAPRRLPVEAKATRSLGFTPDGRYLFEGGGDQTVRIWDWRAGAELCRLFALENRGWAVVSSDGRFDVDQLEETREFHWLFGDAPFTPLPSEIFLRDYYEPRLLAKLFDPTYRRPALPALSRLNRTRPIVGDEQGRLIVEPSGTDPDMVRVRVRVAGRPRNGDGMETGAYDLRLFLDERLIAKAPDEGVDAKDPAPDGKGPRDALRLVCGPDESKELVFPVSLPRHRAGQEVTISAYAFNRDRVRSPVATARVTVPNEVGQARRRAFVVTVGINAFDIEAFKLKYAARDAESLGSAVAESLERTQTYQDVVRLPLTSVEDARHATKSAIRSVLGVLSGRLGRKDWDRERDRLGLPESAMRLDRATPDDLVLLFFSTHGFTTPQGEFHLLPSDIKPAGTGRDAQYAGIAPESSISSEELTAWLDGLDAGQTVLIIDSCHSAAAIATSDGYKHGPFGSRGLGQLAYDKRMQVLAASQPDRLAFESDRLRHGLLTYALVEEGLRPGHAGAGQMTTLADWLRYGERRVPELRNLILSGGGPAAGENRDGKSKSIWTARGATAVYLEEESRRLLTQVPLPTLYDFSRRDESPVDLAFSDPGEPAGADEATPARAAERSLAYALLDGSDKVRQAAARALGEVKSDDPRALDALAAALRDRTNEVRGLAAGGLAARGEPGVRRLVEAAGAPELEYRFFAFEALAHLKPLPAEAVGLMREATRSADLGIRTLARRALGLGREDPNEPDNLDGVITRPPDIKPRKKATPEDVPRLIQELSDNALFSGYAAEQDLVTLGRSAVPALLTALREGPEPIHGHVIGILSRIHPADAATIEAIIAATGAPSTRSAADGALKALSGESPRALEALLAEARSRDPARRADAAFALGGLGADQYARVAEAVLLRQLAEDSDEGARYAATDAVSQQTPLSGPAVAALIDRFRKDPSAKVRSRAVGGLGRVIKTRPDAWDVFSAALMDPNQEVASAALFSLEFGGGAPDQATIAVLLAFLRKRPEPELRARAAGVIANAVGEPSPLLTREMPRLLRDPSPEVRDSALRVISNGKTLPEEAVPSLIEILDRGEQGQRFAAASLLSRVRPMSDSVLGALIAALDDDDSVARAAGEGLSKIGTAAVPHLVAALIDAPQYRRVAIGHTFEKMGPEAAPAILTALERVGPADRAGLRKALAWMPRDTIVRLSDALPTAAPGVQSEVLRLLESHSFGMPRKPEDLARYRAMLRSPHPDVRTAAASLLGVLGGSDPATVQDLIRVLNGDPTPALRIEVARALGRMASEYGFKPLPRQREDVVAALIAASRAADASLRAEAIAALAGWATPGESASRIARIALTDREERVQLAALQLLASLGMPAEEAAPHLRPLLEKGSPRLTVATLMVIEALNVHDDATVRGIISRLRDPDPDTRETAARTLGEILAKHL